MGLSLAKDHLQFYNCCPGIPLNLGCVEWTVAGQESFLALSASHGLVLEW